MKLLIKNAKTLPKYLKSTEDGLIDCEILIEDEVILKIASKIPTEADRTVDVQGNLVIPGLIDPQVHFREPGQENKEDIESGSRAANRGGFTSVICMPNTKPTADKPEVLEHVYKRAAAVASCDVYPTACITKELKSEELVDFALLKKHGAIAFTDDGRGVQDDGLMKMAMQRLARLDAVVLDHAEDEKISKKGSIHLGGKALKYGLAGIDPMSEAVHIERGCRLSLETGCHYHALHISSKESIEHVRAAKAKKAKVTAEVSPHHLLLCDADIPERGERDLDANWKMNPPLRGQLDREACVQALADGTIDMIATDHAPHTVEEKNKKISEAPFGIVGLETAFPLIYTHFVLKGIISLEKMVDMMTIAPAKLFKIDRGQLKNGAIANLTVIDLDKEQVIQAADFHSKGRNTPFNGWKVKGIPMMTIYKGRVVFENGA
ncbi:MAG: dihydroorotase [Bacteriovoracaceae bacterium]|nr:dihydroorotase [Bacteriovoracaceae bacterium]